MQLNYHHLYYFYLTVKEGSLARAANKLHVTPQTVSGQIKAFEHYLGRPLFDKVGKSLKPNQLGLTTYDYAQDIFTQGSELMEILSNDRQDIRGYSIGVKDAIPKVLSFDLIYPVTQQFAATHFVFKEGSLENLLEQLMDNQLDLIISDQKPQSPLKTKLSSYMIGNTGVSFYCAPSLKKNLAEDFPACLQGAPLLLTTDNAAIKGPLLSWLEMHEIDMDVVAEFDDSALQKLFAQQGKGVICVPTCSAEHISSMYQLEYLGETEELREQFYIISAKRFSQDLVLDFLREVAQDEIF